MNGVKRTATHRPRRIDLDLDLDDDYTPRRDRDPTSWSPARPPPQAGEESHDCDLDQFLPPHPK